MTSRCRGLTAVHLLVIICALLSLGACGSTGKNFTRPDASSLVLGQTTVADTLAKLGTPATRSVSGTMEILDYNYSHMEVPGALVGPMSTNSRRLVLRFRNDRLASYTFVSSFGTDSRDFDEAKIASFVKGQTTMSDAIGELGRPTGEAIVLSGQRQGWKVVTYGYLKQETKGWIAGARETSVMHKTARLVFDTADKFVEYDLSSIVTDI